MHKLLLFVFLIISTIACQENQKISKQNYKVISFIDLDLIKSKPHNEIEKFLLINHYTRLENQFANQWQSKAGEDIIQYNDKGVFVFWTYNLQTYKNLLMDLRKSNYENSVKTIKNGLEIETYTRNKETVFISAMDNPENGEKLYSFTFLS